MIFDATVAIVGAGVPQTLPNWESELNVCILTAPPAGSFSVIPSFPLGLRTLWDTTVLKLGQ